MFSTDDTNDLNVFGLRPGNVWGDLPNKDSFGVPDQNILGNPEPIDGGSFGGILENLGDIIFG